MRVGGRERSARLPCLIRVVGALLCGLLCRGVDAAQTPSAASAAAGSADRPPASTASPQVLPDSITRDAQGRATMRAVRVPTPLIIDGRLDEEIFRTVRPASGFYQMVPTKGAPASDTTEVWLLFDDEKVYFAARCSEPAPSHIIANEMRRDSRNILQGDFVGFILDTFHDGRNGVLINISAVGGRRDGLVTNESLFNADWNGVFASAVGRFDGGWTAEVAIPFKSLRYGPGREQVWVLTCTEDSASRTSGRS